MVHRLIILIAACMCMAAAVSCNHSETEPGSKLGSAIQFDTDTEQVRILNGRLELVVETQQGLNANSLRDVKTGRVYADADYVWPGSVLPKVLGRPVIKQRSKEAQTHLKRIQTEMELLIL